MRETTAEVPKLISYWNRPLCTVGGHTYQAIDAALAAMLRNEWSVFEQIVAEGLAARACDEHDRRAPEAALLDAAADAFRYDRDLIAADEINAWLDRTGISSDEWYEHLGRTLSRQRREQGLDDLLDRFPPTSRALITAAFVDGICSGAFERFELDLAGRAAITADAGQCEPPTGYRDLAERIAHTHAHWLAPWRHAETQVRLERLAALEPTYAQAISMVATPERIAELLEIRRLDWRRIETVTLTFPTEHAAREALLCVKSDGLSIHEVAGLSRRPAVRQERFFEDLEEGLRDRLLSTDIGALAAPHAVGRSFELSLVVGHHLPDAADPRVASRARQALIVTATERAIHANVGWAEH